MYTQMDILQATLAANIRVAKYVPSYADQPNDVQHVVKCTLSIDDEIACSEASLCADVDDDFEDFRDKFRGYHVSTSVPC